MGGGLRGLHLHRLFVRLPQSPDHLLQGDPGVLLRFLQRDRLGLVADAGGHVRWRTGQQHPGQSLRQPTRGHSGRSYERGCYGFGLSFNLQPSLTIIGKYFQARRPVANGLAMAGSPVFLCTLAPLNQFLFDRFGWRNSFFILGAVLLNCCVAGSLMRPLRPDQPRVEGRQEKRTCMDNVGKLLDFSLFKHRGFVIYLVGNVLMFFGFFAPIVFLAPYAKHQGVDEYSSAFLLSILAMVDMFARPGTGLLANTKWMRPRVQYLFSFAISYSGICHLLCPLASGYGGLVVYAIFVGIAFGMVCALLFECLMDLVGPERFSSAVGLVTIIECCPVLLGPPIGGTLVDVFGEYRYMYFLCGAMMLAAGLFLFAMNGYNYRRRREGPEDA